MGDKSDVWQGTLALVLKTLETWTAPRLWIARRIEQTERP